MKTNGIQFRDVLGMLLITATAAVHVSAQTVITPSTPFPYYRHDAVLGGGWKELSTPILTYLNTTLPYKNEIAGSLGSSRLGIAGDGSLILPSRSGIMRSGDQGRSWIRIDGEGKETRGSFNIGYPENTEGINFDPLNPKRMSLMFLRGTACYTNGTTWTNLGQNTMGGEGPDFASVDWTTQNPQLMAGVAHGGWDMKISTDGGRSWNSNSAKLTGTSELRSGFRNGMVTVIDANTIIYNNVSSETDKPSGLFRSTNKGASWTKLRNGISDVGPVGKAIGDRVYFAGNRNLWISNDKGANWTSRSAPLAIQGPTLFGDWSNGNVGGLLIASHEAVSYSKDEGKSWISLIGGNSGRDFPSKSDSTMYTKESTGWVYDTDNADYKYAGTWQYDDVNKIIYGSTMGGPVIFTQVPEPGSLGILSVAAFAMLSRRRRVS